MTPFAARFAVSARQAGARSRRQLLARLARDRGRQGLAARIHIVKATRHARRPE